MIERERNKARKKKDNYIETKIKRKRKIDKQRETERNKIGLELQKEVG